MSLCGKLASPPIPGGPSELWWKSRSLCFDGLPSHSHWSPDCLISSFSDAQSGFSPTVLERAPPSCQYRWMVWCWVSSTKSPQRFALERVFLLAPTFLFRSLWIWWEAILSLGKRDKSTSGRSLARRAKSPSTRLWRCSVFLIYVSMCASRRLCLGATTR